MDDIKNFTQQATQSKTLADLEQVRIQVLGKKGVLTAALAGLGKLQGDERAALGAKLNTHKNEFTQALSARKLQLESEVLQQKLAREKSDMTLPALPQPATSGRLHPVWFVMDEIIDIFSTLGFSYETGPDIESEFYNFTALNIDEDHPARQDHDSFFFPPNEKGERFCLRTHTSPVQIRTMEQGSAPFRFIAPGRVYRRDSDQTHTPQFHQIEGVCVDKDIHLGHLKWVLLHFLRTFFERDEIEIRLRPHFFPFTEPSLEVDMRTDKNKDWLEIAGCGMIHSNVLKHCGVDSLTAQGFAFGFGIDRLAMLKYGMQDLRPFFDSDLDWLNHYGFTLSEATKK